MPMLRWADENYEDADTPTASGFLRIHDANRQGGDLSDVTQADISVSQKRLNEASRNPLAQNSDF